MPPCSSVICTGNEYIGFIFIVKPFYYGILKNQEQEQNTDTNSAGQLQNGQHFAFLFLLLPSEAEGIFIYLLIYFDTRD